MRPQDVRAQLTALRDQMNALLDAKIKAAEQELEWLERIPVAGSVGVQQTLGEQRARLVLNAIDELRYEGA